MSDDRIRQLLIEAVASRDDREQARERIHRRVRVLRRRRAAGFGLGSVAAVIVAAVLVLQITDTFRIPIIGEGPPRAPQRVSTACGEVEVDPDTADYLRRWVAGRVEGFEGPCVLAVLEGPEPRFDTARLGPEQPWLTEPAPTAVLISEEENQEMSPGSAAASYPYLFVGTNPLLDAATDLDYSSKFLWWQVGPLLRGRPEDLVSWCQGSGVSRVTCNASPEGILGVGGHEGGPVELTDVNAFVAPDTAAAQLLVDGEPVGWQRPRGRVVWFAIDGKGFATFTIVAYSSDGRVIAQYEW